VPELRAVLRNPQLDPRAKSRVLDDLLGGSEELLRNFLLLLAEKGRIGQIEAMADEFERLVAREERRLSVELTTAKELSADEFSEIVARIERASGRTVDATRQVDPDLIGGLVLQAGSLRLDASVRGRLERLRHELVRR
jgi:F-type H+-transporting ATPase subunit delta